MKLETTTSTWHGAKYTCIRPRLSSWSVSANQATWTAISQWCYDSFGEPGDLFDSTCARWYISNGYLFRQPEDAMMFMLRWS